MGVSRDCPNVLGTPLLSQQRVKLRTSNFVGTFIGSTGTKAHENIENSGCGRSQEVPKIFRAPICRAHCAVIFAIAQLSCLASVSAAVAVAAVTFYYCLNHLAVWSSDDSALYTTAGQQFCPPAMVVMS